MPHLADFCVLIWEEVTLRGCCLVEFEESGEAAFAHVALEGGVVGVLDGLHFCCVRGGDVFCAVVDEEDVGWRCGEAFGGGLVDL